MRHHPQIGSVIDPFGARPDRIGSVINPFGIGSVINPFGIDPFGISPDD